MENKTILLVEDEVLIAMNEQMTLENYGYSVITASSGEKAVEAVLSNPAIDLILMDIDLGKGLDGTEAAEIILRDHDLPIVFLSSHTEPEVVEKTEKITSYGYVVKNTGITVLDASIKMAFKLFDANMKVRETDSKLRKLFANVPDLIYQFTRKPDGSYCCPIASQGVRNIFGCEPEDVLDSFEPIARVIYPEDAKRVMDDIEYSAEHLTYFTCEFRVQIPGREVQWIYSRSTPEKLPDGSVTWFGFNVDITEHKRTQEALQESELRLQTILAHSPLLISEFDVNGRYLLASPATAEIFNLTPEQVVGKTFSELLPPETVTVFNQRINKIRETLQPIQIEDRLTTENGTRCFLTTLFPLLDRGNQLQTIGSIAQEITEQKQ